MHTKLKAYILFFSVLIISQNVTNVKKMIFGHNDSYSGLSLTFLADTKGNSFIGSTSEYHVSAYERIEVSADAIANENKTAATTDGCRTNENQVSKRNAELWTTVRFSLAEIYPAATNYRTTTLTHEFIYF